MAKQKLKSINDLILYILYSSSKNEKSSFEDLVKSCFDNFPQIFSLKNNPQWPDTRKLDSSLRKLRQKKLIKGNPQTFFILTSAGEKRAKEITLFFKQKKLL
ncbi:MAG: hypothetical protein QMC93_00090 [Patescibacteria group bacterium]|nr:hypothetical protein [Patescibacteria group bacterium]